MKELDEESKSWLYAYSLSTFNSSLNDISFVKNTKFYPHNFPWNQIFQEQSYCM